MGAFWNSWQLWEKMCFVLGASIVAVIFLGLLKLAHNHWKLRRYTKLARNKSGHRTEMQRNNSVVRRQKIKGNDVPFGVRAIESGIEVDGVWISRSNTPAPSSPASPSLSVTRDSGKEKNVRTPDRGSTASNISRLEIPQPAHGHSRASPDRSNTSSLTSGNPFDRSVSSDRSSYSPGTGFLEATSRSRPTYQPRRSSHLRYSNANAVDSAAALASLEGRPLDITLRSQSSNESNVYAPSSQRTSDESWSGSSRGSDSRNAGHSGRNKQSSNSPMEPVPLQPTYNRYHSSDLDSLASHRKSHVAETGQLLPRFRVDDTSSEWKTVQQPVEHQKSYLDNRPVSPVDENSDPFITPQGTPLMSATQGHHPEPPTFEDFVRSTSPQGEYQAGEDGYFLPHLQAYDHESPQDESNKRTRQSQVARKVNSGFEILRPGSLNKDQISTNIGRDLEKGEKRHSRKLFRKMDAKPGKASSFTEQV
ncbi:MAG: hypothetical protein Q9167_007524 [Letrouitia subvulpina]